MTIKIRIKSPGLTGEFNNSNPEKIKVKIIRPPLVNSNELRKVLFARARALVL